MAVTDWPQQWAYNTTCSGGTTYTMTAPLMVYSGSTMPAPRSQTALEWLDAEIEATCKLARQGA